jgi:lysozyme
MTPTVFARAKLQIQPEEGVRLHVYDDATGRPIVAGYTVRGVPTIGYGRALDHHNGLRLDEAEALFDRDLAERLRELERAYFWYRTLDDVRKVAIVDMSFPLGVDGIAALKRFVIALADGDYERAASLLLETKFAQDVRETRAERIAGEIRTGRWPEVS